MAVVAANPLIEVVPGLMIWTLLCFGITFFVLRRYIFGPVQKAIDARRDRIRQAIEEADKARAEARALLEEQRAMIQQARGDAEGILAEARRVADSQRERMKEELEAERQRRLEDTTKQIEAETRRALEQIRGEVAELTVIAKQGDRQDPHGRGSPPPDRRGGRRPRLLGSRGGPELNAPQAPRLAVTRRSASPHG